MPSASTIVTFPQGARTGSATVVGTVPDGDRTAVILDSTPFHPVDHTWLDQPGDHGRMAWIGGSATIVDAVMGAEASDGTIAIGADIDVKRGAEGYAWLVAHLIEGEVPGVGTRVEVAVDSARRVALSAGHTACHLATLALDIVLAGLWRRDVEPDALGNPDFNAAANSASRIDVTGVVDRFRLGKSLRKRGFESDELLRRLQEFEHAVNNQLAVWIDVGGAVTIETEGPTIADRRSWDATIDGTTASIPCGGTHTTSIESLGRVRVTLRADDPSELVMTTVVG